MWTQEKTKEFCDKIGFIPENTKQEIKELPSLLFDDEKLLGLIEGTLENINGKNVGGWGLVIATDKRVIFFRKSIIGTITKEETPVSKITSASYRKGLMLSKISITTSNNDSVVDWCNNSAAEDFINILLNLIHNYNNTPTQLSTNPNDPLSRLEKLFELKQKGILTEDEYIEQKRKILNE